MTVKALALIAMLAVRGWGLETPRRSLSASARTRGLSLELWLRKASWAKRSGMLQTSVLERALYLEIPQQAGPGS